MTSADRDTPTWPLNAWYAVGWDADIGRSLRARTVCDIPMVVYRRFDRQPVALEDACWHRLMPLSAGTLRGDRVVCAYHGMAYEPSGGCSFVPGQAQVPAKACVRAFPVVERHRLVWVWPGDPDRADPALVPDLHWAADAEWAGEGAHLELACDYRLVLDNLMDLTHETYVHAGSIGHASVAESPFAVSGEGRRVKLERWMENVEAPPFLDAQLRMARGLERSPPVDRWQVIHFEAPSTIVIDVGVAPTSTGARAGDRSKGVSGRVLNTVTPRSSRQCDYYFAYMRSFALGSREMNAELRAANIRIFTEDKNVLEQQQRTLDRLPGRSMACLAIDAGAVRVRRTIDAMIADELAPSITAMPPAVEVTQT